MIKLCEVNGLSVFALNVNIFTSQYIQIILQLNGLQNMEKKVFKIFISKSRLLTFMH